MLGEERSIVRTKSRKIICERCGRVMKRGDWPFCTGRKKDHVFCKKKHPVFLTELAYLGGLE
jgi:hypothetical protein